MIRATRNVGRGRAVGTAVAFAVVATVSASAFGETGRSVLVVLDASGSMNQPLPEGRTRLEAAKAAVGDLLGTLAGDVRLGLRVYGHQSAPDRKNCEDSELVAGFASVGEGKQALIDKVAGIKARGYTPIMRSLQLAAKDIGGEPGAERTVVLVSDGRETCKADPCAAAKALAAADAKLVVHTIGFGSMTPPAASSSASPTWHAAHTSTRAVRQSSPQHSPRRQPRRKAKWWSK